MINIYHKHHYIDIYNLCSSVPGCSRKHRCQRDQSQGRQISCLGQVGHHDDEDDDDNSGGGGGGGGDDDVGSGGDCGDGGTDVRENRAREDALDKFVTRVMF